MNLLNQIASALSDLNVSSGKNAVPETIEISIVGVVRIDFISEQFYVEAINQDRYDITQQYSKALVDHEVFFEKPIVRCRARKSNRTPNYNRPYFAGTVIENTITILQ